MIYLTGSIGKGIEPYLDDGTVGMLHAPHMGNRRKPGWVWAADNGCFNEKTYVGDEKWFAWLTGQSPEGCLFATAPDVVGDHEATVARSLPWLERIRAAGYPAAFVMQDGATAQNVPWDAFDVAFIGGSTGWKLGREVLVLITECRIRGKPVHVGRVNSKKRFLRFAHLGCASADGTYLAFGPDTNLPKLLSWITEYTTQMTFEDV